MSEEIPPSSLATRPEEIPTGGRADSLHMLRLTPSRWDTIPSAPPIKAAAVVIGSWLVLAWGRFGFQGLDAPRAVVRFALVGVYSWFGLAVISLLGLWALRRIEHRSEVAEAGKKTEVTETVELSIDPERVAQVVGLAHQPLIVLAIAIQIGQAIPIPAVLPILTTLTFVIWFPGMLLAATASAAVRPIWRIAPITAVAYLAWLATAGRHLFSQLGHLV